MRVASIYSCSVTSVR